MKPGNEPISDHIWDAIRAEFALPSLGQVSGACPSSWKSRKPVLQQLVRVFIDEGTFCPGFQFLAGDSEAQIVVAVKQRRRQQQVPIPPKKLPSASVSRCQP